MEPDNSASHSCHILIGQLKWNPSEIVKKCHKLIKNFLQVTTVRRAALETHSLLLETLYIILKTPTQDQCAYLLIDL